MVLLVICTGILNVTAADATPSNAGKWVRVLCLLRFPTLPLSLYSMAYICIIDIIIIIIIIIIIGIIIVQDFPLPGSKCTSEIPLHIHTWTPVSYLYIVAIIIIGAVWYEQAFLGLPHKTICRDHNIREDA